MWSSKYKQLSVALCLSLLGTAAWSAAGWTSYGRVIELNPTEAGRFLVQLDVSANPSGCKNKQWFYKDYKGEGTEYMYKTLLEALSAGQKIRVYVTGACDIDGYSEISSLSIVP